MNETKIQVQLAIFCEFRDLLMSLPGFACKIALPTQMLAILNPSSLDSKNSSVESVRYSAYPSIASTPMT